MRMGGVGCLEETLIVTNGSPRAPLQGGLELLDGGSKLPGIDRGDPVCGCQLLAVVEEHDGEALRAGPVGLGLSWHHGLFMDTFLSFDSCAPVLLFRACRCISALVIADVEI